MKKAIINTTTTAIEIEMELRHGAIWFHAADWGNKGNGYKPTLVGLSWSAPNDWAPACWMVYKYKEIKEVSETFETLPEAFKFFKSLLK